ncbi:MAG: trimeric intracellular cation channel family protein [Hungatella sp.]|nr:trimeric intracellular cation channel family protein [Hungatella sp.]MCI9503553.1 trimeric intracellular cation channel family protein [Hungatella sp.]
MIFILELIGTIAFAFSGCMVANSKRMDIFGVWVLGTVTAVGGGAVRDVLLGQFPPNMFRDGVYVAAATATVVFWLWMAAKKGALPRRHFHQLTQVMDISDSIGLGVFAVVGSQTAIRCGYGGNWFLVIFVGVLTGVGGGLMRDVMANMMPMIFRKRIYASAAMAGSIVYVVLLSLVPEIDAILAGIATVFAIRTMASLRHWDLPVYVLEPEDQEQDS